MITISETERIVNALESEIHRAEYSETDYLDCVEVKDLKLALELIKDLQKENASLEAEVDKQYEQAKADILGNMSDGGTSCHWCIEQHRINAFKEFAEMLKNKLQWDVEYENKIVFDCDIDNLVKELEVRINESFKETV